MNLEHGQITLTNIGPGVAEELFLQELKKVLINCLDINTSARKVRTITLKVSLKPNEDRNECDIYVDVNSSIAPSKPYISRATIGREGGKIVAVEYRKPTQLPLFGCNEEEPMRRVK